MRNFVKRNYVIVCNCTEKQKKKKKKETKMQYIVICTDTNIVNL
jgi:hypothetical protein